jgi:predicted RNA-binding Zn-ribbon protein involved in translation (DUF1610 family)
MALPSGSSPDHICPSCGKPMEVGFVIGRTGTGGRDPATIGWVQKDYAQSKRVLPDRWTAEPLAELESPFFSSIPHFPAWRCTECRRVEFTYGDTVEFP